MISGCAMRRIKTQLDLIFESAFEPTFESGLWVRLLSPVFESGF